MTEPDSNQMDAIDPMDPLDAQLERALASYTPAETPAGLEQRLSARLAAAASASQRRPMFTLRWAWAAGAVVAVSLAIVAIHSHRQTGDQAKVQSVPVARPMPAGEVARAEVTHPTQPARRADALRPAHTAAPAHAAASANTEEEASLSEMRAPSRPAPPAPLTAEERMLLRVVQRRDPEQMAMLNPQVRASKAAESDREFQSFVEQSSTGNE